MVYLAGKTGWFKINTVAYPMRQWALSLSTSKIDVTNFTSNSYSEWLAGFASGEVTASGPLDPTLQLTIGETLTNTSLGIGNNYFITFTGVLLKIDVSTAVDKAGEMSISLGTNGAFNTSFAAAS